LKVRRLASVAANKTRCYIMKVYKIPQNDRQVSPFFGRDVP
jgi:hypothetical protein